MSERIKGFISEVGKIDEEIKRLNLSLIHI